MPVPVWDRRLYWWLLGIYVVLALSALASGITSWDEETDYLGLRSQIIHGIKLITGRQSDFRDIHSNLEYYGVVSLLPAWASWVFQQALIAGRASVEDLLVSPGSEHQLSGFYFFSHLLLAVEFVALSWVVVQVSRTLRLRFPWLAGSIVFMLPSMVGHSFTNTKDLPFALFYTLYTLSLLKTYRGSSKKWLIISLLSSAFLVNQKFVSVAIVFVTEFLYWALRGRTLSRLGRLLFFPLSSLSIALLLQPAAWGLLPWDYLGEAFNTFSSHEWGGCMWWSGSCVGVNHSDWSTFKYLLQWWSVKWPALLLLLILVQLLSSIKHLIDSPKKINLSSPWILLLSQVVLVPSLAVMRQSNLYDADRHMLFIYPALAVIAASGFQEIWFAQGRLVVKRCILSLVMVLWIGLLIDTISINPYQSAYLNEFSRFTHDHRTTALDYWAISSHESLRRAQLSGKLPPGPMVHDSVGPSPLWIAYRKLAGQVSDSASPRIIIQLRDPPAFKNLKGCSQISETSRTLFSGQKLVMSRLWKCP